MNKYLYSYKLSFFAFVILFVSFFVQSGIAKAEQVLFFTPTRVTLDSKNKISVVNVTNLSEQIRTYNISVEDIIMTYEGVTQRVDNFDYSAKRMVRFVPRKFTLKPGERQAIRVMSRVPPDKEHGDYHSHMQFLEDIGQREDVGEEEGAKKALNDGSASLFVHFAYSTLIPVIVSHGKVSSTVSLKSADLADGENKGEKEITLKINREGNGQAVVYAHTFLDEGNGERLELTPRKTINIYRELSEVMNKYSFKMPENKGSKGNLIIEIYDSKKDDATPVDQVTIPLSE